MPDLILHIGLSKCASTSIQKFLADTPGYLGRMSSDHAGNKLATELLRISPVNRLSQLQSRTKSLNKWYHAVESYMAEQWRLGRNAIISREEFSKPIDDYTSLLRFLETLNEEVWSSGNVKVIIVLRRQPEKIASEYAQKSSELFNANQKNFERYAETRLKSKTLDYANLISLLHQELGKENVLTLFVEEANEPNFWKEICSFCGILEGDLHVNLPNSKKSNVKSQGDNKWMLPPPCQEVDSRGFANKVLTWTWPTNRFPKLREVSFQALKGAHEVICRGIRIFERKRGTSVWLHPDIEENIQKRFSDSNRSLSNIVNKDLSRLGYFLDDTHTNRNQQQ